MNEAEVDAIVACLVPQFEITKLAAIHAREHYLGLTGDDARNRGAALAALRCWQHLDAVCGAILRHIDELAERNAAA